MGAKKNPVKTTLAVVRRCPRNKQKTNARPQCKNGLWRGTPLIPNFNFNLKIFQTPIRNNWTHHSANNFEQITKKRTKSSRLEFFGKPLVQKWTCKNCEERFITYQLTVQSKYQLRIVNISLYLFPCKYNIYLTKDLFIHAGVLTEKFLMKHFAGRYHGSPKKRANQRSVCWASYLQKLWHFQKLSGPYFLQYAQWSH